MKRRHTHVVSGLAASALVLTLAPMAASAGTSAAVAPEDKAASSARHDDLPNPLGDAQRELREDAVDKLMRGEARVVTKNGTQVIEITSDDAAETHAKAKGHQDKTSAGKGKGKGKPRTKYVQYDVDREASIFTILTDFGDKTKPAQGGEAGPVHNQIAEPDRSVNNSTIWDEDFSRDHYTELMFGADDADKGKGKGKGKA